RAPPLLDRRQPRAATPTRVSARPVLFALLFATSAWAAPLKLWHAYRGGEEQAIGQLAKQFTQNTGVEVELLAVPYDPFASELTSAIPHDAGPDVFIFA